MRISEGQGINDAGQIVGSFGLGTHAFLYSSGQVSDLGTLGGSFTFGNSAYAINNAGQVTGYSYTSAIHPHAFLYSNGQIQDLGTLGGNTSYGYGINENGQVVGAADTATGLQHAFVYRNGQMTDLGTLPGFTFAKANGINNAGQVVGFSTRFNGPPHAFLYSNGQMIDLNALIDPALHISLDQATAINDRGQIVASGGGSHIGLSDSFLLTPIPEPSTVGLFGVALLALAAWICRHSSLRNLAGGRPKNLRR